MSSVSLPAPRPGDPQHHRDGRETMSRPKNETPEEPTEDEPLEPLEEDDQEEEAAEEEEQTPAEAASLDGSAALQAAIEDAAFSHANKLRKIYGDHLPDVLCPLCEGYGVVDPGTEALDLLQWDETSQECPTCNGYARVRKHTKDQEHMVAPCMSCGATGWVTKSLPAPTPLYPPVQQTTYTPAPASPQMGYQGPNGEFVPFVNATQP